MPCTDTDIFHSKQKAYFCVNITRVRVAILLHCEPTSYESVTQRVTSCEPTRLRVESPRAYELGVCKLTIFVAELTYVDLNKVFL